MVPLSQAIGFSPSLLPGLDPDVSGILIVLFIRQSNLQYTPVRLVNTWLHNGGETWKIEQSLNAGPGRQHWQWPDQLSGENWRNSLYYTAMSYELWAIHSEGHMIIHMPNFLSTLVDPNTKAYSLVTSKVGPVNRLWHTVFLKGIPIGRYARSQCPICGLKGYIEGCLQGCQICCSCVRSRRDILPSLSTRAATENSECQ